MIEYKVIDRSSISMVVQAVNRAIREGWELAGELQVIIIYGKVIHTKAFYQPMTRVVVEAEEKNTT